MTEAIKLKIKKLLDLSQDNANTNEREESLLKAMQLSNQYNIDLNEARNMNEPGAIQVESLTYKDLKLEKWIHTVLSASCKMFFCGWYRTYYGSGEVPAFYGTKENIETSLEMALYLVLSIKAECKALYRGSSELEKKSFKLGAAAALWKQACDKVDSKSIESTGTSLMVVRNALTKANEQFKVDSGLSLVSGRSRSSSIDRNAYNSGKTFGSSVSLNKQIKEVKRLT